MSANKIMIIRHAEKPDDAGGVSGVSLQGSQDTEDLTPRGWQRSGALVRFFAPFEQGFGSAVLSLPDSIFASAVASHSKSFRPQHTVLALAEFLGKQIHTGHAKGNEVELVQEVVSTPGNILIAWEHEAIPFIANQIVGDTSTCPQSWPGERFDLVWVLHRPSGNDPWVFAQVAQLLLSGDRSNLIPLF